jgi:dihydroorotate dehydrogenase electron transfer subunit
MNAEVRAHRGTIALEDARVLSQRSFDGNQFILRIRAPRCAQRATPGSFAHLTCDPSIPMRRPLSIMRANADDGWVEFLYKPVGHGLAQLATREADEIVSVLGPIGHGFDPDPQRPVILAVAGGVGIPPVYFLTEMLRDDARFELLVLLGSEVPFPFATMLRDDSIADLPSSASHAIVDFERWNVPSALASNAGLEGCYFGHVPDLARAWLAKQPGNVLERLQIVSCGPEAMLHATAVLAREFDVPAALAVEEFMACGVGGCAGCIVPVHTREGIAMKRVCVDGPVFDARELYPG